MPVLGEHPDQRATDRRVVFHQQKLCHGTEGIPFTCEDIAYRRFSYNGLNPPLALRVRPCSVHRRILFGVAAWLLGAATATAGSLLAISLLGQGITGSSGQLLTQDAVNRALASEAAEASASHSPTATATATAKPSRTAATPTPAAVATSGAPTPDPATASAAVPSPSGGTVLTSSGGEVLADCQAAGAYLISWSPSQGYEVGGVTRGPAATARVTFYSNANRVTMVVSCSTGVPSATSYTRSGDE